jgi:hypothetical protein
MHFGQILTYLDRFKGQIPEKAKHVKMTPNSYHYKKTVKHASPSRFLIDVVERVKLYNIC